MVQIITDLMGVVTEGCCTCTSCSSLP